MVGGVGVMDIWGGYCVWEGTGKVLVGGKIGVCGESMEWEGDVERNGVLWGWGCDDDDDDVLTMIGYTFVDCVV